MGLSFRYGRVVHTRDSGPCVVTRECPVNFDGQETISEFGATTGVERIATCETEVDPDHPLFRGDNGRPRSRRRDLARGLAENVLQRWIYRRVSERVSEINRSCRRHSP
jgi:hypothetical protein